MSKFGMMAQRKEKMKEQEERRKERERKKHEEFEEKLKKTNKYEWWREGVGLGPRPEAIRKRQRRGMNPWGVEGKEVVLYSKSN